MDRRCIAWVLPMVLFIVANVVEGKLPRAQYPIFYMAKAAAVALALIACAPAWRRAIRWDLRALGWGTLAGIAGIVLWLGIETYVPYPHIGSRTAFNPFEAIASPELRTAFVAVRFVGLALLVPVMEELFWRGFGLRFITDQDRWDTLPPGQFSTAACLIVTAGFAAVHPEWLAAALWGLGIAWLLRRTGSLMACIVAHMVTNLLLGIYVVVRGAWALW